jgi:hypothetical protein
MIGLCSCSAAFANALELRRQQPVALFYRSLDVGIVAVSASASRVVHSAGSESTL